MSRKHSRPPAKKNPEDYDCDDYIQLLEKQLPVLKQLRQQLSVKAIDPNTYQSSMMQSISVLQASVEGIRHTFIPLVIPQFLQIPRTPPSWITLSQEDQGTFLKFASKNEQEQKELLVRFKKPGLRSTGAVKTAQALAKQQEMIKNENEWQQVSFLANSHLLKLRVAVPESPNVPKGLFQSVSNFVQSESLDVACDESSLEVLLLRLFDEDEGPLATGHRTSSIIKEISEISSVVYRFASGMTMTEVIGGVRTFVASLHRDALIRDLEKEAEKFKSALGDAADIFGDKISMGDFGAEGVISPYVTEGMKDLLEMTFIDQIALKFHEIGDHANEHGGGRSNGAKMIAAGIISENLKQLPSYFFLAVSWCSDEMFQRFTNKGMYIQALDLILNLISDFSS